MAGSRSQRPRRVFISYAHKDERLRRVLEAHLAQLERDGLIEHWHDRKIGAGQEWKGVIDDHLARAEIILLLISADFIASDYCYDVEMKRALARHRAGRARVIPIILRPADWHTAPFGQLQALPTDGKPVTTWRPRDSAWVEVARGIRRAVFALPEPPASRAKGAAETTPSTRSSTAPVPVPPTRASQVSTSGPAATGRRRGSDAGAPVMPRPRAAPRRAAVPPEATVTVDEMALAARARALVAADRRPASGQVQLCLTIVGGPARQILRPSQLEDDALARALMQEALFGRTPIFSPGEKTDILRDRDALLIAQEGAALRVDEAGSVRIVLPARSAEVGQRTLLPALIEEDIRERLERAIRFAGAVLNRVDPSRRLTDLVIAAGLLGGGWLPWRTRAEQAASPHSAPMGRGADEVVVPNVPLRRARAAFGREARTLAADLTVLLKREMRE